MQACYGNQLAMLYLWQDDYNRAKHYASQARNSFLQVGYDRCFSISSCALNMHQSLALQQHQQPMIILLVRYKMCKNFAVYCFVELLEVCFIEGTD
jgi:hypothetical protein